MRSLLCFTSVSKAGRSETVVLTKEDVGDQRRKLHVKPSPPSSRGTERMKDPCIEGLELPTERDTSDFSPRGFTEL